MKAKLSGKIKSLRQIAESGEIMVEVDMIISGKIESDKASGKDVTALVTMRIKPLFAEELHFGQVLHFDLRTET